MSTYMTDFSDNLCQRIFTVRIDHLKITTKITENLPKDENVRDESVTFSLSPKNSFGVRVDVFNSEFMTSLSNFDLGLKFGIGQNENLNDEQRQ